MLIVCVTLRPRLAVQAILKWAKCLVIDKKCDWPGGRKGRREGVVVSVSGQVHCWVHGPVKGPTTYPLISKWGGLAVCQTLEVVVLSSKWLCMEPYFFHICAAANVLHEATKASSCFLGVRRALRRGDHVRGSTDARAHMFFQ